MTLKRSKYVDGFVAQCDACHDIMDFEGEENFIACVYVLKASGWSSRKGSDGKWAHKCPDCKEESNDAQG